MQVSSKKLFLILTFQVLKANIQLVVTLNLKYIIDVNE